MRNNFDELVALLNEHNDLWTGGLIAADAYGSMSIPSTKSTLIDDTDAIYEFLLHNGFPEVSFERGAEIIIYGDYHPVTDLATIRIIDHRRK